MDRKMDKLPLRKQQSSWATRHRDPSDKMKCTGVGANADQRRDKLFRGILVPMVEKLKKVS